MSDPWACAVCGQQWAIPSLARLCEAKHEREGR